MFCPSHNVSSRSSALAGAGPKIVSESSDNKWRHIRSKKWRGARFSEVVKRTFERVRFLRICEPTFPWYFIMRISASCGVIASTSWAKILTREIHLVSFLLGKNRDRTAISWRIFYTLKTSGVSTLGSSKSWCIINIVFNSPLPLQHHGWNIAGYSLQWLVREGN